MTATIAATATATTATAAVTAATAPATTGASSASAASAATVATTAATATTDPAAAAAAAAPLPFPSTTTTTLLQVSDPHFGTERAPALDALLALVQAERPSVLVLSGDITQRATPEQFGAARAFVDRLAIPVLLAVPGNHDIPLYDVAARLFNPYGRYRRRFGEARDAEYESADLLLLALNTTRWWRHKNGELSARQIDRVARRVERAGAGQCRLVVTHQPLAVPHQHDRHDLVRGHAMARARWAAAGVDAVVGGHIHLPYVIRPDGGPWVVQAGTALSSRVRHEAGNSVNLFRVQPGRRCSVERWDHVAAVGRFERIASNVIA